MYIPVFSCSTQCSLSCIQVSVYSTMFVTRLCSIRGDAHVVQDIILVSTSCCQSFNVPRNSCLVIYTTLACCVRLLGLSFSRVFAKLASVLKTVPASGACTDALTLMWKATKELCRDAIYLAVSAELQGDVRTLAKRTHASYNHALSACQCAAEVASVGACTAPTDIHVTETLRELCCISVAMSADLQGVSRPTLG